MKTECDVIILGAGMAGASLAFELAGVGQRKLCILEAEDQPGRHSTGRSAAMFFENYGNQTVRALTRASRAFLERPPQGFCDVPLLSPRSCLFIADAPRLGRLDAMFDGTQSAASLRRVDAAQAVAQVPILRDDWVAGGVADDSGHDIDVAAMHQAYLRMARQAGARIVLGASEMSLQRRDGLWIVRSRAGEHRAPLLVNAAGAWADQVAQLAGARPVGLQPLRRTAMLVPAPAGIDIRAWPLVDDVDELFYFRPEGNSSLLLSPANEDAMPPCDVMPEELDVAIAVDRFERATTLKVERISHRWAGLRSFVADRSPVIGFDPDIEGFFWLAGQGGYGIQMAPGAAQAAAGLLTGTGLPANLLAQGLSADAISPARAALA